MEIRFDPTDLARFLLRIVAVLMAINCVVLVVYFMFDGHSLFGTGDFFDFGVESNIPTFYSAVAILLASIQLALIARARKGMQGGQRGYWIALSLIFLFLALDEATAIHEEIGDYFERYIEATGYLYFMWVVPYGVAVIVIGLAFLKFVFSLPVETRNRFIVAGAIFLMGAVGLEMPGAKIAEIYGTTTISYTVLYTFEELLEMLGIVLFNYALASYFVKEHGTLRLVLESDSTGATEAE